MQGDTKSRWWTHCGAGIWLRTAAVSTAPARQIGAIWRRFASGEKKIRERGERALRGEVVGELQHEGEGASGEVRWQFLGEE
jgi:hypothetical protein